MTRPYQYSNPRQLQETASLLRQHPKGLGDADDRGRCNGDRKIVELAHKGSEIISFQVVENVCRGCWHEPARILNNDHIMELRPYDNDYFPVKDGDICYLFATISTKCISCHKTWVDGSEEACGDYHIVLHSSYSLSKCPTRAAEWNLPEPLIIRVGEPRPEWTIEDPPIFSPYITEAQNADVFSSIVPQKSTIEAVVENGYITRFRKVDKRCACGKVPWSIDKPGGQRWTTIRKAWCIPVVVDKICYCFCDVSVVCGHCKKPWAELPAGEEKRPYALLLLDTLAAHSLPPGAMAPLKLRAAPPLPAKVENQEPVKGEGQRSLVSRVFRRRSSARTEKSFGTGKGYVLHVSTIGPDNK
ncbi:uncharacterized protein BDZ99DRAFT_527553 [Mytilinidion resinicola]|uniref:Uncharacterized protein n=1 Tax=Mytilinidion resinicola TaxID=574789 RepID=A0A6A6Y1J9_9PEZI|nr:uncharacterized protein BDZ99DRAFT_527553 [Mytilinidion resinicola]KAF2802530.1 hypothetical protein BDZ99DRAFT_527553 [Mytilinidion resinicola]